MTSILKRCCEIIRNHEEDDCECWKVDYHLSYEDGKIKFHRVVISPTYEESEWGYIDTVAHGSVLFEEDATICEYTNLAVEMCNDMEFLKHKYGSDVESIELEYVGLN